MPFDNISTTLNLPNLEHTMVGDKRYYRIDNSEKKYPSITTILSYYDNAGLIAWQNKIGIEEATKIANLSKSRGTSLHTICEKYLRNEPNIFKDQMPDAIGLFNQIKSKIDDITKIFAIEQTLYSHFLKAAGRTDVIGEYINIPSVIDFKNYRGYNDKLILDSPKIVKYLLQCAGYALMFEELTNIKIGQVVLIFATNDSKPEVKTIKLNKYKIDLIAFINKLRKEKKEI